MVTDEDFRKAGFTPEARNYPRSERAFQMLCAFNGVRPEDAPPAWRYYPNQASEDAWERVARIGSIDDYDGSLAMEAYQLRETPDVHAGAIADRLAKQKMEVVAAIAARRRRLEKEAHMDAYQYGTVPQASEELVERLGYHREHPVTGELVLRNPDGPEAAAEIARLEADNERLRGEREALHKAAKNIGNALMSFTPGGSEFFIKIGEDYYADAEACQREARRRLDGANERALTFCRGKKAAESALAAREAEIVMGFYENEWPEYTQGARSGSAELSSPITAKEANELVELAKKLAALRKKVGEVLEPFAEVVVSQRGDGYERRVSLVACADAAALLAEIKKETGDG